MGGHHPPTKDDSSKSRGGFDHYSPALCRTSQVMLTACLVLVILWMLLSAAPTLVHNLKREQDSRRLVSKSAARRANEVHV